MEHSNDTKRYGEARRVFFRDLARALAKFIAAQDYAGQVADVEPSS